MDKINKKFLLALIITISLLFTFSCTKSDNAFKQEYESVNGKVLTGEILYRALLIDENNPYRKVELEDIIAKLENKETFYLYVGDPLCPWCRSGLEKMIEVANKE